MTGAPFWLYVSLPHATYALDFERGICVDAPPIAHRCLGKHFDRIVPYLTRKGARIRPFLSEGTPHATA